jgi:MraZ protein
VGRGGEKTLANAALAMLFTGTYPRTLDDKKRLALPKRVRELLKEPATLFVTPGPDQSLRVYTVEALQRLAEKLEQTPAKPETRVFERLHFAQTEAIDLDRSGRILIPDRLLQFAGLAQEVVMIGVRDHLELWDAQRWHNYLSENAPRFDSVAEAAFKMTD